MSNVTPKVIYTEVPDHHSYAEVWDLQKHLQKKVIASKRSGVVGTPSYLLLCQHKPVFTLGKSGSMDNLVVDKETLQKEETEFFKINRGGDITFHGPGQITGYPILDLDQYYNDVHRYVRELEEVVIRTIATYGIVGSRVEGYTGVWIVDELGRRKICAIGVHMSRWVSLHGFALNVATDLNYFKQIIPCGIVEEDTSVTSISKELNRTVEVNEVMEIIKEEFRSVFGFEYV